MTAYDFFYISLGVGFLVLVGCAVGVTVQIYRILKDINVVSSGLSAIAYDVSLVKDGIKVGILRFIKNMLEKNQKGSESKKNSNDK